MKISGFTFVHNALEGGYPVREAIQAVLPYVDEVVVVDMESTDGTREFINKWHPETRIIDGSWGNNAGETLAAAHAMHVLCEHDRILHFEADEVWSDALLFNVAHFDHPNIAVHRLQLEQNFQRCRWYPEPVHRIFPKGTVVKNGHTTNKHASCYIAKPSDGFLWDITNCFRDNWRQRYLNQDELWHNRWQERLHVPLHFAHDIRLADDCDFALNDFLAQEHWKWTVTPFDIPDILKPLVGKTRYE